MLAWLLQGEGLLCTNIFHACAPMHIHAYLPMPGLQHVVPATSNPHMPSQVGFVGTKEEWGQLLLACPRALLSSRPQELYQRWRLVQALCAGGCSHTVTHFPP